MLTLLSGGTGTPKLLQGLVRVIPPEDITVIVNTGEDVEISGLRVSPDLDTVIYTLADIIDDEKWYGIRGDSFSGYEMLEDLGHDELLRMGDRDRAVKLYRTMRMREGAELSQITREICEELGVKSEVLPMTDDRVMTRVFTSEEEMTFHEFWIEKGGEVEVEDVNFLNSDSADPAPGVVDSIGESDLVIVGPSNPVTSVSPIISIDEILDALKENRHKTVAVSPVIGDSAVSGPTGVLMRGLGREVSPHGVAEMYEEFVSKFFLHETDEGFFEDVKNLDMEPSLSDILIPDISSRVDLARSLLEELDYCD